MKGWIDTPRIPLQLVSGDALRFSGHGTVPQGSEPTSYEWDFANGQHSVLEDPGLVTFANPGVFEVTLDVKDGHGNHDPYPASRAITVVSPPGPLPDLRPIQVSVPDDFALGQLIRVGYTVKNEGDGTVTNKTWVDGIYISGQPILDASAIPVAFVTRSNALTAGGSYSNSVQFAMPNLHEGKYYLLVSVDDQAQVLEWHKLNNEMAVQITAMTPQLTNGVGFNSEFTSAGEEHYYRIDVPEGSNLRMVLSGAGIGADTEVYARFGLPPVRGTYDYRAVPASGSIQSLSIPTATPGTWYVLVRSGAATGSGAYTMSGVASALELLSVVLDRHANNQTAILSLQGAGFVGGIQGALVSSNGAVYPLGSVEVDSFSTLTATVAANTVPPGLYSIRVMQPGGESAVLTNAFTMLSTGVAKLKTDIIVPGRVGYHQLATIYVEYRNEGNAAMPAPLLVVTGRCSATSSALS